MSNHTVTHPILQFKPTRAEASKLSSLMRRLNKLKDEYGELANISREKDVEYINKRMSIKAEIDVLAAEIGKRTLGELPLTLRTDRTEETGQEPVVVLSIEVDSGWDAQYSWDGRGVRLRKDGSVSMTAANIRLDSRRVWRRQLDGGWTALEGQSEKLNRPGKC